MYTCRFVDPKSANHNGIRQHFDFFFFFFFRENKAIHMKCEVLFYLKKKKKITLSSASVLLNTLRVKNF